MLPQKDSGVTSTVALIAAAKAGDTQALARVLDRYLPRLTRWASGRLPRWARDLSDTDDIVQDTLVKTVRTLDTFEVRGEGALQAYLRQAVFNRVYDEIRNRGRRPERTELADDVVSGGPGPLEIAIGSEVLERYERGLQALDEEGRAAVIARAEMGCSYAEIAELLDKPSPDAARMTVARALVKVAEAMRK